MSKTDIDKPAVIQQLNRILELELAGVIRYTHYSFMIYGYGRIPIVSWLRSQAAESQTHAHEAGELITDLDGELSLKLGPLLEKSTTGISVMLEDSLQHEGEALAAYEDLLELVKGRSVMMEEYATRLISDETRHVGEVRKMLRAPGD